MVPHTQHVQYLKENFLHLIPFCYIFLISILCFYTSPSACIALMNKKPMDCCHYNHSVRLLPKRSFVLSVKSLVFLSGKKITLSWEKFQLPLVHVVIVVLILTLTSTWNSFYSTISVLQHFISIKALMQFLRLNKKMLSSEKYTVRGGCCCYCFFTSVLLSQKINFSSHFHGTLLDF